MAANGTGGPQPVRPAGCRPRNVNTNQASEGSATAPSAELVSLAQSGLVMVGARISTSSGCGCPRTYSLLRAGP